MTPEQRKEYNQQYYSKNKKAILNKILQKEPCKLCGKEVAHQNMKEHQRLSGCKGRICNQDINELRKQIEMLKLKVEMKI